MADSTPKRVAQRPSFRGRFLSVPTVVSLVALAALLVLLATRFDVDWGRTGTVIRNSNPWWLVLAVVAHYTTFLFRGARWRLLLMNANQDDPSIRGPSTLYCGVIILMSWFANSVTWFRMGDAYRAYAYADDMGTSFSRTMGTILADRVMDVAVVFTLMVAGLTALYVSGQVRPSLLFVVMAAALLALGITGLLAMYLLRQWVASRLPGRIGEAFRRFQVGTMGSFRRLHLVFLLGVLAWLAEVSRLFLVLQALGLTIAGGLLVFVPMANGLLSTVPLTPGGFGIVEAGITGLLMLELAREEAVAVALLDRSISYLSIVVTGGIAFAIRHLWVVRRRVAAP